MNTDEFSLNNSIIRIKFNSEIIVSKLELLDTECSVITGSKFLFKQDENKPGVGKSYLNTIEQINVVLYDCEFGIKTSLQSYINNIYKNDVVLSIEEECYDKETPEFLTDRLRKTRWLCLEISYMVQRAVSISEASVTEAQDQKEVNMPDEDAITISEEILRIQTRCISGIDTLLIKAKNLFSEDL